MDESIHSLVLREPTTGDWQAIGRLADAALDHVPGAPSQLDWVENRRVFPDEQSHWVGERDGGVVGYAAVERRADEPAGLYRIFVVTSWPQTPEVAERLYGRVAEELSRRAARGAWLRELADDEILVDFMRQRGFSVRDRYRYEGSELISLEKDL